MINTSKEELVDEAPKAKRRKKVDKAACGVNIQGVEDVDIREYPFARNEKGLLKNVIYPIKDNGLVDWRQLISKEYIVLNKYNLAGRGISVDDLSEEEISKLIDESPEEDLIIKLAGFRQLAILRGLVYEDSTITHWTPEHVVAKTVVKFTPNFENRDFLIGSGVASATIANTDPIFSKFLETIATNRSFVRAIRNALGIASVGQDELREDDIKVEAQNVKIQSVLAQGMEKAGLDLSELKDIAAKNSFVWNDKWTTIEKIDPAAAMSFIPFVQKIIKQ